MGDRHRVVNVYESFEFNTVTRTGNVPTRLPSLWSGAGRCRAPVKPSSAAVRSSRLVLRSPERAKRDRLPSFAKASEGK